MKTLQTFVTRGLPIISLAMPFLAVAQGVRTGDVPIPTNLTTLQGVICTLNTVTNWFFFILIAVAVIYIIIAAFKYITAQGDEGKIGEANHALIYAVIAIAVGIFAKAVPLLVGNLMGIGFTVGLC